MNGSKATKIWNPLKTESTHVLPAVRRRLPAGKPARENFAEDAAGGMAGEKNKTSILGLRRYDENIRTAKNDAA